MLAFDVQHGCSGPPDIKPAWSQNLVSDLGAARPFGLAIDALSMRENTTRWVAESTGSLQKSTVDTSTWAGSQSPVRKTNIVGAKTELHKPHGIAIHPRAGNILVSKPNQPSGDPARTPAGLVTAYGPN
jgi:hypothetical protein